MIEHLEGTHETVNYRQNTNLRIYDNIEYEEYPMHWHSPIEIVMPIREEYRVEYADTAATLREGDILIICPGVLHHFYPCEGERYIIQAELTSVLKWILIAAWAVWAVAKDRKVSKQLNN